MGLVLSSVISRFEGSSPWCTRTRATHLYSVGPTDLDHDAVIRIGGAAPGRQAHSLGRRCSHACLGSPPPRIVMSEPAHGRRGSFARPIAHNEVKIGPARSVHLCRRCYRLATGWRRAAEGA